MSSKAGGLNAYQNAGMTLTQTFHSVTIMAIMIFATRQKSRQPIERQHLKPHSQEQGYQYGLDTALQIECTL